jgi:hypothetical protein
MPCDGLNYHPLPCDRLIYHPLSCDKLNWHTLLSQREDRKFACYTINQNGEIRIENHMIAMQSNDHLKTSFSPISNFV